MGEMGTHSSKCVEGWMSAGDDERELMILFCTAHFHGQSRHYHSGPVDDEAGAHALAYGLISIKEHGLTARAPITVLLSRNRFGQQGADVIRQALVNSGWRHVIRMEGFRPTRSSESFCGCASTHHDRVL